MINQDQTPLQSNILNEMRLMVNLFIEDIPQEIALLLCQVVFIKFNLLSTQVSRFFTSSHV